MKLSTLTILLLSLASLFITAVATNNNKNDDKKYVLVDDIETLKFCWRVEGNGNKIKPGDEIRLAKCDDKDDRQLFYIDWTIDHPNDDIDYVLFSLIRPKLNDNLVIGVNKVESETRLRVKKFNEDDIFDATQWFYSDDEGGALGMGTDEICQDDVFDWIDLGIGYDDCLYVTNQGTHVDVGDIVYLKTYKDIKKIRDRKNSENAAYWICSESINCY